MNPKYFAFIALIIMGVWFFLQWPGYTIAAFAFFAGITAFRYIMWRGQHD